MTFSRAPHRTGALAHGLADIWLTKLCSVVGWPSLSDGRLRVRSGDGMTHYQAGGLFLALNPDLSPAAASLDWPVT